MRARSVAVMAAVLLGAAPAIADDKEECAKAYTEGQSLRDEHKLIEARTRLRVCAQQTCASFMQNDCATWLAQVESRLPAIVLSAHTPAGDAITSATVTMDGATQPLASKLDGRAIDVNPGEHEFVFVGADGERAVVKVIVPEGEHAQKVAATLGSAAVIVAPRETETRVSTTPTTTANPVRTVGFVVGAFGLASLAAGGVLGLVAATTKSSKCQPDNTCVPGTVSTLYTEATASTATVIAGVALVATGIVLVLVGHPRRVTTGFRVEPLGLRATW
jgi:hypothetical protein